MLPSDHKKANVFKQKSDRKRGGGSTNSTRCPDHLSRQFLTTASTFPYSSKNSSPEHIHAFLHVSVCVSECASERVCVCVCVYVCVCVFVFKVKSSKLLHSACKIVGVAMKRRVPAEKCSYPSTEKANMFKEKGLIEKAGTSYLKHVP